MRKHLPAAALLSLALIATPAAAAAAPDDGGLDTDLLDAALAEFAAAGSHGVVVEVRDGDDVWSAAAGTRAAEGAEAAETDDRVRIASLTKSMIAVVLLQLEAEGALDLDDPLSDHLPDLLPYEDEPTVRHLLQHTGGLHDYFHHLYPSMLEAELDDLVADHREHHEPQAIVDLGTQDPQLWAPGEGWSYSNTGYFALGLLIEQLTGNSVGHELEQRVFEPVGMDDAYFPHHNSSGFRGDHLVPQITTGDAEAPYFDSSGLSNTQLWAAGAVIADMDDVNDFYRAVADGRTLLSAEQFAAATDYVETGLGDGYGLGFVGFPVGCPDDPEALWYGHTGGGLGHTTYSFHNEDGRQVTATWNIEDWYGTNNPEEFLHALDRLLVAGFCGIDMDQARTLDAPSVTDRLVVRN